GRRRRRTRRSTRGENRCSRRTTCRSWNRARGSLLATCLGPCGSCGPGPCRPARHSAAGKPHGRGTRPGWAPGSGSGLARTPLPSQPVDKLAGVELGINLTRVAERSNVSDLTLGRRLRAHPFLAILLAAPLLRLLTLRAGQRFSLERPPGETQRRARVRV